MTAAQQQTADAFGYKWQRTEAFDSPEMRAMTKAWLLQRYGDVANAPWWKEYGDRPKVLDAGCGAGLAAIEMFGKKLHEIDYLGIDFSDAYKTAALRFKERGLPGRHQYGDMMDISGKFDVVLAEGALHHTDSTKAALRSVTAALNDGGRVMFYVYRTKAPVREFTDDFIREKLQSMAPEQAWDSLYPLTKLGEALGNLNLEIDVPETVDLLGIPSGKINIQRLFYWYVVKAFYRPELSIDEMNHINFDWFAPKNSHRQTTAEVKQWCEEFSLDIERLVEEDAGITVIAKKRSH